MARTSLTPRSVWLRAKGSRVKVRAEVGYDTATRTITVDPRGRLAGHTTYRMVVTTGATDRAGNRLDQRPWKTGLQPYRTTFRTS